MLYAGEIKELKELLPDKVNVNVERRDLECVLDSVDHIIIDVKTLNSAVYENYTGVSPQKMAGDIAQTKEEILRLGFEDIDDFKYIVPNHTAYCGF